jgi:hypothetical protein
MSLHFNDQEANVFGKIVAAYSENCEEQINNLCKRNGVCSNVRNTLYMSLALCFKGLMSCGNGDGQTDISMYVKSGRLMNFSSDTSALPSRFLDQTCVRNPLRNPSRIIFFCLKYDSVGFTSAQFNRDFIIVFYFRGTAFLSETTIGLIYQNHNGMIQVIPSAELRIFITFKYFFAIRIYN